MVVVDDEDDGLDVTGGHFRPRVREVQVWRLRLRRRVQLDEDEVVVAAGSALLRRRHSALRDGVEVAERHDADDAANLDAADVDALAQPKRTQRVVTTSLGMVATRRRRATTAHAPDAQQLHAGGAATCRVLAKALEPAKLRPLTYFYLHP